MRKILAILWLLSSVPAWAQESELHAEFRTEKERFATACSKPGMGGVGGCLSALFTDHPFHVTGGSIAPQNGIGVGAALVFEREPTERWRLGINLDGVVSNNGSWRAGAYVKAVLGSSQPVKVITTNIPPPGKPAPVLTIPPRPVFNFYVQSIRLNKLSYYGEGPSSSTTGLAFFGMQETITGGTATIPIFGTSGLALFGEMNGRWVDIRGRYGDSSPSIGQIYSEATAPGLARQPAFAQFGEGIRFNRRLIDNHVRLKYAGTFQQFSAVSDSSYSFRRYTLDFLHEFPLYRTSREAPPSDIAGPDESPKSLTNPRFTRNREGTISLRVLLTESMIPAGHVEPFYFQPTLGGSDINGNNLLPSYADYRYRAPNLMLLRASIEHSLWGPFGVMAQADTGRVALTRGDLGFDHLRHSYAVGFTIRAGGFPQASILFAWGGVEGNHTTAYINSSVLGGTLRPSLF